MNLNPFDMRGPEFLFFYLLLMAAITLLTWLLRRQIEGGAEQEVTLASNLAQDPYQVAFLRGGKAELLRVAVVSLLERGLITSTGDKLVTTSDDAVKKVRRPLDRAILTKFAAEKNGLLLFSDETISGEANIIGEALKTKGLLPDDDVISSRIKSVVIATALLWAVAGIKIYVALSRGRTNVLFLVLLAISVPFILNFVTQRPRTAQGDKICKYLRNLFSGLKTRRESHPLDRTNSELTFLAAVFGVAATPLVISSVLDGLRPPAARRESHGWSWGSSCGSSCSSGSSCSGGSSCGGGGGCGGCGS